MELPELPALPAAYGIEVETGHDDGNWCQTLNPDPLRTFFIPYKPEYQGSFDRLLAEYPRTKTVVFTADQMRAYALEAVAAERERIEAAVIPLLDGIELTECEYDKGWWETSTGAEFGEKTLAAVLAAIRAQGSKA